MSCFYKTSGEIRNWNNKYPVISISFGRGVLNGKEELHKRITAILKEQADKHDIKYSHELIVDRFAELIYALYKAPCLLTHHKKHESRCISVCYGDFLIKNP
ncbi:hypothetical protein MTBBW1_1950003 [Desulfamplus magnetovallimortis]|uniref:Uncharacterized protein n=1 Tax=Desulfamplus magnetovallimortis TaxID=1246637 RepID=A0A1W1HB92_9BACT|nr:hypothetical protein [Desulfamplus magnetovallimortis]SLM29771.1 hypothetical protein MTBBW1_1950003 [Desulfamplus magnetovallimortis]